MGEGRGGGEGERRGRGCGLGTNAIQWAHIALWPVAARRDPDFVLVGRTDAMRTDDVRKGIRRGNLYAKAGCDLVEVFPNTLQEARLVPKESRRR